MVNVHEGAEFDLEITAFDDEGRGRARLAEPDEPDAGASQPFDVAVRGALPGDRVTARIDRVWPARGLAQARAVSFTARTSLHTLRTCPHNAPCPGCPFEGVDAGFALAFKRARIAAALVDAGLGDAVALVDDVVPARAPRQKAKLSVGGRPGALRFGLFVPHSHHLVDTDECPHVDARILDAIAVLADVLDQEHVGPDTLKAVVARVFDDGVGVVLVTTADIPESTWRALWSCVDNDTIRSLAVRVDRAEGNSLVGGDVVRSIGPAAMRPLEGGPAASVDAFCQPDPALAVEMYRRAAAFLVRAAREQGEERETGSYVDAYAGAGGFARALVEAGATRVIAIERAEESVRTLRSLAHVDVVAAPVEAALPRLADPMGGIGGGGIAGVAGVVADPPKSGLREAATPLARLGAARIVLVACDPDAGARDAKALVDAGYRLVRIEPIDLFPATTEVETMFFFATSP